MTTRNPPKKIVVDESIHGPKWERFARFARGHGLADVERLFVAERHPGIPDAHILHHLLDRSTVLVTNDRPFHNEVLSRGLMSIYVGEKEITRKRLPGIRPRSERYEPGVGPLKESYELPKTEVRSKLVPEGSPKELKRLRTKRRRIRNHFGGLDNLSEVAVTVSWRAQGHRTLIGIRIRVSANVAIKAIDASESYVAELIEPQDRGAAALAQALVLVVRLMLHQVRTWSTTTQPSFRAPSFPLGHRRKREILLRPSSPSWPRASSVSSSCRPRRDRSWSAFAESCGTSRQVGPTRSCREISTR